MNIIALSFQKVKKVEQIFEYCMLNTLYFSVKYIKNPSAGIQKINLLICIFHPSYTVQALKIKVR